MQAASKGYCHCASDLILRALMQQGGSVYRLFDAMVRAPFAYQEELVMSKSEEVRVVVLLSAWSSGSTSIAGYLDRCGAYTCPPHQETNDPRTPNSFESLEFRNAMTRFTDEMSLRVTGTREDFVDWFRGWLPIQKKARLVFPAN